MTIRYETPLNILIVEDSPTDMALLELHLLNGDVVCHTHQVDSAPTFRQALENQSWDVIISDYNLPGFSAEGALEIMQSMGYDLPFIVVSGHIKDIEAVSVMKAGAHDFVQKDNMARLIPAIDREMKEAGIRRERKQLLQELQQAKEFAESANQRKSRVLAFVAHEFKNPLRAAQTFAELLDKSTRYPLCDEQRAKVQAIMTACQHIQGLLNDILDIAPIEAGRMELAYENIDLHALLDEVLLIVMEPARSRDIRIYCEKPDDVVSFYVDPKRLRQILINLLSNAVKYTHAGDTVCLMVRKTLDNTALEFHVQDGGPGIPEEELKNLFADYYRIKNMFSKQKEGLGLGLALTKTLVELHGGAISVESTVGVGSTFTVTLPFQPAKQEIEPEIEMMPQEAHSLK